MKNKKSTEEELNEFLQDWDEVDLCNFINDIFPLFKLYDVSESDDWVKNALEDKDEENVRVVRLARTAYLMSRIADFYAGRFLTLNMKYKNLWKRMEQIK